MKAAARVVGRETVQIRFTIRLAVAATVLLSIFAHGLTAKAGIDLYARKIATLGAGAPEHNGAEAKTA